MQTPSPAIWKAQVVGNRADLEFLAKHFTTGRIRISLAARGDGFVLESDDFGTTDSPEEILRKTNELLPVLSGVLRLERGAVDSLKSNAVIQSHSDGKEDAFLYLHDTLNVRAEIVAGIAYADNPNEVVPIVQPPPRAVKAISLALSDAAVAKAYRLLGKGAKSWVELYRVYEVVEADLGGQHKTQKLGWVSEQDIRRFKHSANSVAVGGDDARHGAEQHSAPTSPLTLEEAESVVHRLLGAWLEEKLKSAA